MTSIAKEGEDLREIDPNDPQGDLFVTPEEIEAARAALAEKNPPPPPEDTRTPTEKRRDEWKARWNASKEQRDKPAQSASESTELVNLRAEFAELKRAQYDLQRKLKDTSEALARAREELAHSKDTITLAEKFNGAPLDVEVTPKMIVTLEIDSDCGCIKHARPSDFQFAITQAGSIYIRSTDRGLGKFFRVARAGVTRVRVVSSRVIVPDEPATLTEGVQT